MLDGQDKGDCASRVMAHYFHALKLKGVQKGSNHACLVLEGAVEAVSAIRTNHGPESLVQGPDNPNAQGAG